jgi:hypothetical protein
MLSEPRFMSAEELSVWNIYRDSQVGYAYNAASTAKFTQ